jgi:hypothetical protein
MVTKLSAKGSVTSARLLYIFMGQNDPGVKISLSFYWLSLGKVRLISFIRVKNLLTNFTLVLILPPASCRSGGIGRRARFRV